MRARRAACGFVWNLVLGGVSSKVARSLDRGVGVLQNGEVRRCDDELALIEDTLAALVSGLLIGLAQYQAGLTPCYVMAAMPSFARAIQADGWRRLYMLFLIATTALVAIPWPQLAVDGPGLLLHLFLTALTLTLGTHAAQSLGRSSNPLLLSLMVLSLPLQCGLRAWPSAAAPDTFRISPASALESSLYTQRLPNIGDSHPGRHPAVGTELAGIAFARIREPRPAVGSDQQGRLRRLPSQADVVLTLPPLRSPPGRPWENG